MHNIISWYNRNRKRMWLIIFAIAIIGSIVWRILNLVIQRDYYAETNQEKEINTNEFNSIAVSSSQSAISRQNASSDKGAISTIDNFVTYCNSKNIQEAYNLLSDECKEELYPDINKFQSIYYMSVFGGQKRNVSIQNWIGSIYMVQFYEDALAMGKVSDDSMRQDYISITKDNDGNYKLNINNYIGRTKMNRSGTIENITVKAIRKDSYMNYEIYTFEVTNNSDLAIALGDISYDEDTYLVDDNDLKYTAYMNELVQEEVAVYPKQTKTISIKYFNEYSSERNIREIVFNDIILDYEAFSAYKYGDHYNTTQLRIDI